MSTRQPVDSARIADYLREQILAGQLRPGDWIRQEEVAERLGASRIPVREALRILQAEGLTVHEARRGARVPKLSSEELDVTYQMRERLEPLAVRSSLPHLSPDVHGRLEDIQAQIERLGEESVDLDRFLDLDREFHLLSYSGCSIEPLITSVVRLWNSTQHYRRSFVALGGRDRMWVVNSEHRLILDALRREDAEDAERFLTGHIRRTRMELAAHPEIIGD